VKISCPACAAKYSIADEKVQDRLAKIRCRKCGTTIVIDGKVAPPNVYAADAAAGSAVDAAHADAHSEIEAGGAALAPPAPAAADASGSPSYTVDFGENDQRTMALAEIVDAYNAGQITAETYLWADGFADWTPLADVPEVVEALHAATSSPAAAGPEAQLGEAPFGFPGAGEPAAPAAQPAPAAQAPRAAARAVQARSSDLFGGIATAGSEEDVAARAAREAAAPAPVAATGARNESSVLFSLSALTSAAGPSKPSSPKSSTSTAKKDDSGLIDLKALTASAPEASEQVAPLTAGLGLGSPLGLGAPLAPAFATDDEPAQKKSKSTVLILAAAVFLGIVVVAGMLLLRTAPQPEVAQAATPERVAVSAATATTTEVAATATAPLAKPPATGTADEGEDKPDAGATAKKAVATGPRGGAKKTGGGGAAKTGGDTGGDKPAAAAAPAAAPKKSACGCAPNDLECHMACAAR
jgi:predicted Zn finger-like uncharacterized protein